VGLTRTYASKQCMRSRSSFPVRESMRDEIIEALIHPLEVSRIRHQP